MSLTSGSGSPGVAGAAIGVEQTRRGLDMVKRIAAVPGEIAGGRTLARGEYWVLGDAADASTDSKDFGPVKRSDLLGRAWILYWPADRWHVFD